MVIGLPMGYSGSLESAVELAGSDGVLPAFRKLVFGCRKSLQGFSMHRGELRNLISL